MSRTEIDWIRKRRYDELGEEGLRPLSKRSTVSPRATHVVGKVLFPRRNCHVAAWAILWRPCAAEMEDVMRISHR